jgi:hypothetical protein
MYDTRPAYFESREQMESAVAHARGFESREAMLAFYETRNGLNVTEALENEDRRRVLALRRIAK